LTAWIGALLVGHGVAHLVGFAGPWRLADLEGVTFQSALFDGRLRVSERTMRGLGLLWLLLAIGFLVSGAAALAQTGWWSMAVTAISAASLLLCVANWPAARIGFVVNVLILAGVQVARVEGWIR
jgi:hypothetical protein